MWIQWDGFTQNDSILIKLTNIALVAFNTVKIRTKILQKWGGKYILYILNNSHWDAGKVTKPISNFVANWIRTM